MRSTRGLRGGGARFSIVYYIGTVVNRGGVLTRGYGLFRRGGVGGRGGGAGGVLLHRPLRGVGHREGGEGMSGWGRPEGLLGSGAAALFGC